MVDPTKIESILFIEKQIQNIIKFSSCHNFFFVANIKFLNYDFEKIKDFQKKFQECDKHIKSLVEKYDIKLHYINLDNLTIFKNQIRKFISLSFIKKGMYDLKLGPTKRKTIFKEKNRRSVDILKVEEETSDFFET
jgi:hypothetical protein